MFRTIGVPGSFFRGGSTIPLGDQSIQLCNASLSIVHRAKNDDLKAGKMEEKGGKYGRNQAKKCLRQSPLAKNGQIWKKSGLLAKFCS